MSVPERHHSEGLPLSRPARLQLPPPKAEERLAIKMSDFNRIREAVRSLSDPIANASNWATTFLGIAVGSGIAWLLFDDKDTTQAVVVAAVAIGGTILAVFMGWIEWQQRKSRKKDKERICEDMDNVEAEAPHLVTETTPVTEESPEQKEPQQPQADWFGS